MKTWKKPDISESNKKGDLKECTKKEMQEIEGGWVIGTCIGVGIGGDMSKKESGIFGPTLCYVIGF